MANNSTARRDAGPDSPFNLADDAAYGRWREQKLRDYPVAVEQLWVAIEDPYALTSSERWALCARCHKSNMVLYRLRGADPGNQDTVRALGQQLGLVRLDHNLGADDDGIAAIQRVPEGRSQEYIPYTERPINWHTDGYYNDPTQQIRGVILHCVCDAARGGANRLLDPEVVYRLLRDENPKYVAALSAPDAMTIPANVENGRVLRLQRTGPVFSVNPDDGTLHMRYTARTRSIRWRADSLTRAAVKCLEALLASELTYILQVRLQPGEGIVCNNVLHTRAAFSDDPAAGKRRLLLRARYYDRIAPISLERRGTSRKMPNADAAAEGTEQAMRNGFESSSDGCLSDVELK